MQAVSYAADRFSDPWSYSTRSGSNLRFTLSYRDVEDLLAERGLDVSYETIRRWVLKFGRIYASNLRRRRPRPCTQWHLDEMVVMQWPPPLESCGVVDAEVEVLDMLVQPRRNKAAAVKLLGSMRCGTTTSCMFSVRYARWPSRRLAAMMMPRLSRQLSANCLMGALSRFGKVAASSPR